MGRARSILGSQCLERYRLVHVGSLIRYPLLLSVAGSCLSQVYSSRIFIWADQLVELFAQLISFWGRCQTLDAHVGCICI